MKTIENFDCVKFQREVRLMHYEECKGDYNLMISNQNKRLQNNKLWIKLLERQKKTKQLTAAE
jgi:hypothetical protein